MTKNKRKWWRRLCTVSSCVHWGNVRILFLAICRYLFLLFCFLACYFSDGHDKSKVITRSVHICIVRLQNNDSQLLDKFIRAQSLVKCRDGVYFLFQRTSHTNRPEVNLNTSNSRPVGAFWTCERTKSNQIPEIKRPNRQRNFQRVNQNKQTKVTSMTIPSDTAALSPSHNIRKRTLHRSTTPAVPPTTFRVPSSLPIALSSCRTHDAEIICVAAG